MAKVSWQQTSFLGGEWSKAFQGRLDDPRYATAMAKCYNAYPTEQGAWTRRPGTQWAGFTRNGQQGRIISYPFFEASPYDIEFTNNKLRFWNGTKLVTTFPIGVSSVDADPAQITTSVAHDFSTGDQVLIFSTQPNNSMSPLLNRAFSITVTGTQTFTLTDAVTGATFSAGGVVLSGEVTVGKIVEFVTPYSTDQIFDIQAVFDGTSAVLLCPGVPPQVVTILTYPTDDYEFFTFSFSQIIFADGPYLNPDQSTTVTVSSLGRGNATFSVASITNINNGAGFQSTDVGRLIRLAVEPPAYSTTATYPPNAIVSFPGQDAAASNAAVYYINGSGGNLTGVAPSSGSSDWLPVTNYPFWQWGIITAIVSTSEVDIFWEANYNQNTGNPGQPYLTQTTYQLGVYTKTPGINGLAQYPTCGTYHEGRLWLAGAIANRFDASVSNTTNFGFAPTVAYGGQVLDSNGFGYTFDSSDANDIVWMAPSNNGITCGTQAGEWLIQASTLAEPLSPTNIQAHRVTKIGCAAILPILTSISVLFVQKFKRRIMEFLSDVFTGKYIAPNLSEAAQHLSVPFIEEISYQEETSPIIWARCADKSWIGMTYRRVSTFLSDVPKFVAWHHHQHGANNLVESISVGPSTNGNLDSLGLVTVSQSTGYRQIEFLTPGFDEGSPITAAWFLDQGSAPATVQFDQDPNPTELVLGGLDYMEGQTVGAFVAGLDCGTYTVSGGRITVPFGSDPDGFLGLPYLSLVANSGLSFGAATVTEYSSGLSFPCIVGSRYTSQGQLMRPQLPQQTGAQTGPALAKTRRIEQIGMYLVDTQDVQIGTTFTLMHTLALKSPGGTKYPMNSLISGVYWDQIENDYSFDAQVCWQCGRGYPATIAGVNLFIQTQDR